MVTAAPLGTSSARENSRPNCGFTPSTRKKPAETRCCCTYSRWPSAAKLAPLSPPYAAVSSAGTRSRTASNMAALWPMSVPSAPFRRQAARLRVRGGTEQYGVQHAVDGGVGADTASQRGQHSKREARALAELAKGEADVVEELHWRLFSTYDEHTGRSVSLLTVRRPNNCGDVDGARWSFKIFLKFPGGSTHYQTLRLGEVEGKRTFQHIGHLADAI